MRSTLRAATLWLMLGLLVAATPGRSAAAQETKGALLLIEEATTIDAIPAPATPAILKTVGDGKLSLVETFTKTGQPAMYEAGYTDKQGKKHEVLVKADGTAAKP